MTDDLLFYDVNTGVAQFYTTDGAGGRTLLSQSTWSPGWQKIIPGYFSRSSADYELYMGLAFYDASGNFAIYSTDGAGHIGASPLWTMTTRTTWSLIIPGYFTPAMSTSLLFYDQAAGYAEIWDIGYATRTRIWTLRRFASYNYWRASWTDIVAGRFLDTGQGAGRHQILLYEAPTGHAELYYWDANNALVMSQAYDGVLPVNAQLYAGNFGGSMSFTDVLAQGGVAFNTSDISVYRMPDLATSFALTQSQSGIQALSRFVIGDFAGDLEEHWFSVGPTAPNASITEADRKAAVRTYRASIGATSDIATLGSFTGTGSFFKVQPTNELQSTLDASGPIWGYVTTSESNQTGSLLPGETLSLHVATSSSFSIGFYKITGEHVVDIAGTFAATNVPLSIYAYRDGAAFPVATTFVIPATWASNVYLARITAGAATFDIPFIVRASNPGASGRILTVIPDATYEAYNIWGGRGIYGRAVGGTGGFTAPESSDGLSPYAFKVSFERSYYGIFGFDYIARKWEEQEKPFAEWLATEGFASDYCTTRDLDLSVPSAEYRLVVFVGHHEYWSLGMRNNISQFSSTGGSVAYLSGNTCHWQVRFDYVNRQMICYKYGSFDPAVFTAPATTTVHWRDTPLNWPSSGISPGYPSSATTGVLWPFDVTNGDAYDSKIVYEPDATALSTGHWAYEGTDGLMEDVGWNGHTGFGFTHDSFVTALGSECDATDINTTPNNFVRLARGFRLRGPNNQPDLLCAVDNNEECEIAVMGIFQPYWNSSVFTASTIQWCNGLLAPNPSAISRITRNVFQRFTNVAYGPNGATATLSPNTSDETGGWGAAKVLDGGRLSIPNISMGISSGYNADPYEPIDLIIQLPAVRTFQQVVLYPRSDSGRLGQGFPLSFTIDVWDGSQWITRVNIANYPIPTTNDGESFRWSGDTTDRIRIHATRLGNVTGYGYYLQYKSVEVY